jgi:hypothetical protein
MWRNLILVLVGLALIGIAVPAGADNTRGQCNRTMAVALGSAQQVVHGVGDPFENCTAVGGALMGYVLAGCMDLLVVGDELRGLIVASNAPDQTDGISSPLGNTICTALFMCGFGSDLPLTVCPDFPR